MRLLYTCFEANVRASDSSVFDHEMPGGQYTNLMVCQTRDTQDIPSQRLWFIVPSLSTWTWYPVDWYVHSIGLWNPVKAELLAISD